MRVGRLVAALAIVAGCSSATPPAPTTSTSTAPPQPPAPTASPIRVLMLTATAGFRHESISTARTIVGTLAASSGFVVSATEDLRELTAARLASTDVLMFALTSGELALDDGQKRAILEFVNGGGGFIGVHSASDTLYEWADYGRLVGAYFKEHPWVQSGAVRVEDQAHPITIALGPGFTLNEEFYTFRENPRPLVHVLLALDAPSVGAQGDFPLAWTQSIGRGRSYYNALGHFAETWTDPRFQTQIAAAIAWTAGR